MIEDKVILKKIDDSKFRIDTFINSLKENIGNVNNLLHLSLSYIDSIEDNIEKAKEYAKEDFILLSKCEEILENTDSIRKNIFFTLFKLDNILNDIRLMDLGISKIYEKKLKEFI